jgi:hypothetical protein
MSTFSCKNPGIKLACKSQVGIGTQFPSSPIKGCHFFNKTKKAFYVFNGKKWVKTKQTNKGFFNVETSSTQNGPTTSGPFPVHTNGDTLRLWSAGGLFTNVTPGSALIQVEPNNILIGDGIPTNPPTDCTRPTIYLDQTNNTTFLWNSCNDSNTWTCIATGDASNSVTLPSPRFQVARLFNGPGAPGFENQDVLHVSHMIKDVNVFTNLEWVIGKQKITSGYNKLENFNGVVTNGKDAFYQRNRNEGIPVTNTQEYPNNGGKLGTQVNLVPATVNSYKFQALDINWWSYFSGVNGIDVSPTSAINDRRSARPRGRRRGISYSGSHVFLRVYLRAENPDYTTDNQQPRWLYSGPSNEIIISNVEGVLRISHVKVFGS